MRKIFLRVFIKDCVTPVSRLSRIIRCDQSTVPAKINGAQKVYLMLKNIKYKINWALLSNYLENSFYNIFTY